MRKHYIGSLIFAVLVAVLITAPHVSAAANRYVYSGATGNGSGSDWTNAYTQLPATLVRGDTYYLADGTYPGYVFSTPTSGSSIVTIRKAISSDHGTNTGWDSSMGDGEAFFSGPWKIQKDYITIDGVTRNSDWVSGYGIRIKNTGPTPPADMRGAVAFESSNPGGKGSIPRVGLILRNVNLEGPGLDDGYGDNKILDMYDTNGGKYSNLYIHDGGVTVAIGRSNGSTLENSVIARNNSSSAWHAEGVAAHASVDNLTISNNRWEDIEGSGYIVLNTPTSEGNVSDGWKIFGNVVYRTPTNPSGRGGVNGFLSVINARGLSNAEVYNNTILDGQGTSLETVDTGSFMQNVVVRNNLWYSPNGIPSTKIKNDLSGTSFSNNSYFNYQTNSSSESGAQFKTGVDPFINTNARDFRLAAPTCAGSSSGIASYERTDVAGNTRGADGNWDRGAYEYTGTAPTTCTGGTTPPPPPPPSTKFVIGDRVQVSGNDVNVRTNPTTGAALLGTQSIGALGTVVAGSTASDSYNWWQINYDTGVDGWSVEDYLVKYTTTVDVTPPTVAVAAPVANQTVSGVFTLLASASDASGIQNVKFYINGGLIGTAITTAPYQLLIDTNTSSSPDGNYNVQAVAKDLAGNVATSTTVVMIINNTTPPPLGSGLVAAYSFNEGAGATVADSSGSGNNGSISNAVWTGTGKFGNALSFNGTNAMVTIPDSASLDLTTGMTLEAWVNPSVIDSTKWRTVILKEQPGYLTYDLYADSADRGGPRGNISTSAGTTGGANAPDSSKLTTNTWTHLATTYDGTTLKLYRNGNWVSSKTVGGNIYVSNGALRIGGNSVWSTEYFGGLIDEVRVYNRALSQTEIATDMNTGIGGGTTPPPPPPPPSGLTATVTYPANNQIVSGVVTLAATVSDSTGVQGVQFTLNEANIGDVRSYPYTLPITTTGAAEGNYLIRALAKDSLGRTLATSTAVTMVIGNTTTPPPPPPSGGGIGKGSKIKVTTNKLKVRSAPGGSSLGTVSLNTQGIVNAGPTVSGGYTWWQVQYQKSDGTNGLLGWSVQNYIAPVQ